VIRETDTPSWINTVPYNFGQRSAGSLKADEWRTMGTLFLPIALTILLGDDNGAPPPEGSQNLQILDHSMALFQAVLIAMRYTITPTHIMKFRELMKEWTVNLRSLYPAVQQQKKTRTNIHVAFHLYDFLQLFGPVISWWTFPFERLIGILQKMTTNERVGGIVLVTTTYYC
jgi:hypothetical protein